MDDAELSEAQLQHEADFYRWMTELNITRLGGIIWGFLNTALKDRAKDCFEGADELNGFDA